MSLLAGFTLGTGVAIVARTAVDERGIHAHAVASAGVCGARVTVVALGVGFASFAAGERNIRASTRGIAAIGRTRVVIIAIGRGSWLTKTRVVITGATYRDGFV